MARVDYERMGADYERSRGLDDAALAAWREAIARYLPPAASRVADIGSGTGVFADAIARWFDIDVIGIEPARAMRAAATTEHPHPRVAYCAADAHHLPLSDASCDAAWLSTVIHHIADLPAAALELARVVRRDGVVLIRSSFPGHHAGITLFRYFPGAARVASSFPSVEATAAAFHGAGFALRTVESVPQVTAPNLTAALERVRLRADTTLALLSDAEFEAGLRQLAKAAQASPDAPVLDQLTMLVFRRVA